MSTVTRPFMPPDRSARHSALALSFARAVHAMGAQAIGGGHTTAARTDDATANGIIERGAVAPFATGSDTALLQNVISTLGAVLGPRSATAQLLSLVLGVSIEGLYGLVVPGVVADPNSIGWISEGNPIPVRRFSFDAGPTLTTKKLGMITVLTRELFQYTSSYAIILDLLQRNFSLGFEKYLFGTAAATDGQPAGLLYGITPTGAESGGGDHAMLVDLGKLGASVAAISSDLFYIAGPAAGLKISIRAPFFKYPLAISAAVADDTVICLSPSCVVVAGGNDPPKLDVSATAVLHMETAPLPLSTAATASFPIRSVYQSDCVAVRLIASIDWALRNASAIAVVNSVTW